MRNLSSRKMMGIGTSSSMAAISSRFRLPMSSAKNVGIAGPTIAPALAPIAMIANSLFACSRLYRPDMNVQNTDR